MKISALLVGFVVGIGAGLLNCSPSTCNPGNCLGCCDPNGRCAPGTEAGFCGKAGALCASCASGRQCLAGVCSDADGGTGGGTAGTAGGNPAGGTAMGGGIGGGGAAAGGVATAGGFVVGGGGTSGCQTITTFDMTGVAGYYRPTSTGTQMGWAAGGYLAVPNTSPQLYAVMQLFTYHGIGTVPTVPFSGTIPAGTKWRTCDQCFLFSVACTGTSPNTCNGEYLATAGNFTVSAANANPDAGTFSGQASNLFFTAWNTQTDQPVSGQPCVRINDLRWSATWP